MRASLWEELSSQPVESVEELHSIKMRSKGKYSNTQADSLLKVKDNSNQDSNHISNDKLFCNHQYNDDQDNNIPFEKNKIEDKTDDNILDTFGTESNLMQYILSVNKVIVEPVITESCIDNSDSKGSVKSIDTCNFGSELKIDGFNEKNVNHQLEFNDINLIKTNTNSIMSKTVDLINDNTNKFSKKASPLKNMLNRMKSSGIVNNNPNQFKSPNRDKNEILLNETGVLLKNGIFKTTTNNSNPKLINHNSLSNLNNKFNIMQSKNKKANIVNSNYNNTMPMESIINANIIKINSEIREEDEDSFYQSRKPSPQNTTLDINV